MSADCPLCRAMRDPELTMLAAALWGILDRRHWAFRTAAHTPDRYSTGTRQRLARLLAERPDDAPDAIRRHVRNEDPALRRLIDDLCAVPLEVMESFADRWMLDAYYAAGAPAPARALRVVRASPAPAPPRRPRAWERALEEAVPRQPQAAG